MKNIISRKIDIARIEFRELNSMSRTQNELNV